MKKRLLASLLSLCLIVGLLPTAVLAADVDDLSGYCGSDTSSTSHTFQDSKGKTHTVYENLTWKLKKNDDQSNYTLSISGNGPMSDKVQWRMDTNFAGYADLISDVQIDTGVTSIASGAFREMDALTDIFIPDTVNSIENWAFYDSPIENLVVSQDNTAYVTDSEGVLYTSDMATLVYYPKTRQGAYKLPETVTQIGPSAFMDSNLTALDMSEAVNLTTMSHQMLTNTKISDTLSIPENITTFSTYSCAELKDALVKIGAPSITVKAYAFSKTNAVDLSKVTQITHEPVWNSGAYYEGGCQVFIDNQEILNTLTGDKDFNGYPIIFYLNHGTVQDDRSVVKDGYTFGGWYENPDYSDGALTGDPHTGKTYYAKWVSEITFDANGGAMPEGITTPVEITEGQSYSTLPVPTRTGYTFTGWYTAVEGGTKVESSTVPTGNTTLYAQWTPNTYTIQFNGGNGANGSTTNVTATYDQPVTLPANGFTMAGKNFAGWAKEATATEAEYGDQTEVLNLAESGTITLYAVWTGKEVRDPDLTDTVVPYNGQPQQFRVESGYTVKYYQNRMEEVANPVNAGVYDVEISRDEDDDYAAYHGRVMGGLVIKQAPLTVKADNKSIRMGDQLPEYTYTVSGWQGNDTDDLLSGVTATCPTADANKAGDYTITVDGPASIDNYKITYVNGTLTVSRRSSGGGSGSSDNERTYAIITEDDGNGSVTVSADEASAGTRITVTVKPDAGYELDELTVTDAKNKDLKVTKRSETTYTFHMADSKVTVEASFAKDGTVQQPDTRFDDVAKSAWYYNAVEYVAENGIMSGVSAREFAPNAGFSRAMLAQTLYAMSGKPAVKAEETFADVAANAWYADAVNWAAEKGYVSGVGDGKFAPDASVTREQMALILYRYAGSPDASGMVLREFADGDSVSAYAVDAIRWAVHEGLISGMENNTLAPQGTATRAQVAQILMNFHQKLDK